MTKVAIIGGSGFIGGRLIETLLEAGHEVSNLDRQPSARYPELTTIGNILDEDALAAVIRDADAIVHLAAEHRDDVQPISRYQEVNVDGTRTLIAAAERAGIDRILFTSTVAVYGLDKNNASEADLAEPFNEYGRTKLAAEALLRGWADADASRSLTIIRPSVVFGEANRGNVYTLANQLASGRFVMVGRGDNRKSMSYVGNLVHYLAGQLDAPAGIRTFNFADKPDLSTRELVALIKATLGKGNGVGLSLPLPVGLAAGHVFDAVAKVTGRSLPISAIRVRKFVADTTVNTDRLQATGYRPAYPLDEALRRTIAAEFQDQS